MGLGSDLPGLAAAVVGEKNKAPLVEGLQQHGAAAGAEAIGCAQHHGIGFQQLRLEGLLKPAPELLERIEVEIAAPKPSLAILEAQLGDVGMAWRGAVHAVRRPNRVWRAAVWKGPPPDGCPPCCNPAEHTSLSRPAGSGSYRAGTGGDVYGRNGPP